MKRLITFLLLCFSISIAHAWTPDKNKTIMIVTGFGPGGNTHTIATWFQQFLESKGYTAIVDVKPGAKGQIATSHLARQSNNGYTLLVTLGLGMLVHTDESTANKPTYKDFELVTIIGKVPLFLITHQENQIKTTNQLLAAPRQKISIATSSETTEILAKNLQKTLSNHDVVIVPYKNNGDVMRDLIGGHIDYAISTYTSFGPLLKQNKITVLGTTSNDPNFPKFDRNINTLHENFGALNGIVLPKNTPQAITDFYLNVSKEFLRSYKTRLNENNIATSDDWFGPNEFLKEVKFLESLN